MRQEVIDKSKSLIFANGDLGDGVLVRRALDEAHGALLIAADGGARAAAHYGVTPQVVIGDMDSIAPDMLAGLVAGGTLALRHPPAKDETDLELALLYAVEQGARWIRVIGAAGGRLDQTLSNVYLLALPALRDVDVRLVTGSEETSLLLPGEIVINGVAGDTVSLLPVSGAAHGVTTEGLAYPLRDEALTFGPARGVSNVMTGARATVQLRDGALIVVHTLGRA
jgi:thiamine pyrophosphokinase